MVNLQSLHDNKRPTNNKAETEKVEFANAPLRRAECESSFSSASTRLYELIFRSGSLRLFRSKRIELRTFDNTLVEGTADEKSPKKPCCRRDKAAGKLEPHLG